MISLAILAPPSCVYFIHRLYDGPISRHDTYFADGLSRDADCTFRTPRKRLPRAARRAPRISPGDIGVADGLRRAMAFSHADDITPVAREFIFARCQSRLDFVGNISIFRHYIELQ